MDELNGVCRGGSGKIWRTNDAGNNWFLQLNSGINNQNISDIQLLDSDIGFAILDGNV